MSLRLIIGIFMVSLLQVKAQDWEVESIFISINIPLPLKPNVIYFGDSKSTEKISAFPAHSTIHQVDLPKYLFTYTQTREQNPLIHFGFKLVDHSLKPAGYLDNRRWEFSASLMPLSENKTWFSVKEAPNQDTLVRNYDVRIGEWQKSFSLVTSYSNYLNFGKRIRPYAGLSMHISVPTGKRLVEEQLLDLRFYKSPFDSLRYDTDGQIRYKHYYLPREKGLVFGLSPFLSIEWSVTKYFEMYLRGAFHLYISRFPHYTSHFQHYRNYGLQLGTRIRLNPKRARIYRII